MAFQIIALVIAVLVLAPTHFGRSAEPAWLHKLLSYLIVAVTVVASITQFAAYPAALPVTTGVVAATLFSIAALSPALGLLEHGMARKRRNPYEPYPPRRFLMHLITNLLGAGIAVALLALARDATGEQQLSQRFANDYLFNIFLPLSMVVSFTFIRWQQVAVCPELRAKKSEPSEDCYYANSLPRWHQLSNFAHLTLVLYVSTTTLLYLLGYSMRRALDGNPLELQWSTIMVVGLGLAFMLACGTPWVARDDRGVFFMFLTGTPALLCAVVLWLALYESSKFRDGWAFAIVTVGYLCYVLLVVIDVRRRQELVQLHHFSSVAVALILSTLLAGMYLS